MASSVAQPLERQFAQIPGIAQMTSTSSLGSAAVTIQFDLNRNIDGAANDVQGAINAAGGQLPKNLPSPPTYRKVNPAEFADPVVVGDVGHPAADRGQRRYVDAQLAQQISQISGVAQVFVGGQQKPADPRPDRSGQARGQGTLAGGHPQPDRAHHGRQPQGQYRRREPQPITIYANDQLTDAKDWNDVIIAYRNGGPLRIRDIGRAVSGPEDDKRAAWANGKRGVFLVIFKQPGANVIETVDRIKAAIAATDRGDPAFDQDQDHQRPNAHHPRRDSRTFSSRC